MTTVSDRRLEVVAAAVAVVTALLAVASLVLEILGPGAPPTGPDSDASAGGPGLVGIQAAMASAYAVLGAVVVARQPRNPVGWLMVCIGFFFITIGACNELYLQVGLNAEGGPGSVGPVIWIGNWAWVFSMIPAVTFLPLLFPTGHQLTPRWRAVGWLAAAAIIGTFVQSAFAAGPLDGAAAVDNPFGVRSPVVGLAGTIGLLCLLPAIAASIASLVLRFRRASGAERQQVKWVASAALLLPVAATGLGLGTDVSWPLVLVALSIVAVAITVAMLRYRLYDIDVVINRALVYGSLTATLATVYVGSVLLLQLALSGLTRGSGLAVAASTLAVAACFGPARGRIQRAVDRRFFRSRYDAARTIQTFGARLRDEVDLVELSADLQTVVVESMQPVHVSLWLRVPEAGS